MGKRIRKAGENPDGCARKEGGQLTFVDAFAGCGGLSLGLMRSGWKGLFAIEKDKFAYETLQANLLSEGGRFTYQWPDWLPQVPQTVDHILSEHAEHLIALRGQVDLLAGGPPCQGFSSAGRRKADDARNKLVHDYLKLVEALEPSVVLIENVRGIASSFNQDDRSDLNYAAYLQEALGKKYVVHTETLRAPAYGVPQMRPRFFLIGLKRDNDIIQGGGNPFDVVRAARWSFLFENGLQRSPSSRSALSDLEVGKNGTVNCEDTLGYEAIDYHGPETSLQRFLNDGHKGIPSDTRLAKHKQHIVQRFSEIVRICKETNRLNTTISKETKEKFGIKKQAIRVLDPENPSPTVTSMPDDLLHYSEPRTLTVRENARLQTFPDWFAFKGKYTTGGHRRRNEVPRFTQVANAVPPVIAEIIGMALWDITSGANALGRRSLNKSVA